MSQKFPRIPHLPFSPGQSPDDERLDDAHGLLGESLVLTEKVDGSNLCFTSDAIFARSHAGPPRHPSFDLAKATWASVKDRIPPAMSVFGEWLHATHSIYYDRLPAYVLIFAVREDASGTWRSWEETERVAQRVGFPTVPVLGREAFTNEAELRHRVEHLARQPSGLGEAREGLVVRLQRSFGPFPGSVAKWVRAGHNRNPDDWAHRPFRRNQLRS